MTDESGSGIENNEELSLSLEQQLLALASGLGFVEDVDLSKIREELAPNPDNEILRESVIKWQDLAQKYVTEKTDPTSPKPQVGLLVAISGLYHRAGLNDHCLENLEDAITYAEGIGDFETADKLIDILNSFSDESEN